MLEWGKKKVQKTEEKKLLLKFFFLPFFMFTNYLMLLIPTETYAVLQV